MAERPLFYILKDKTPVPVDTLEWGAWFEKIENRRVALSLVGEIEVSTVFLGIDHGFGDGPPVLFETMVFDLNQPAQVGGRDRGCEALEEFTQRYCRFEEAEAGHREVVRLLEEGGAVAAEAEGEDA